MATSATLLRIWATEYSEFMTSQKERYEILVLKLLEVLVHVIGTVDCPPDQFHDLTIV